MPLTGPFTGSFFSGVAATLASIPYSWPAALNGRGYMLDDARSEDHVERSVASQKQQFVSSDEPGERSLNPEGAWRRAWSSWHHGAGQTHREGDGSDTYRFRTSKGVDVWTRGELTLLDDTENAHSAGGSSVQMVASQGYLYYLDGQTVYRTDLTTETAVTGTPAATATGICSTGSAVYVAFGTSDVYKITGTSGSLFVGSDMDVVGAAKQRILGARTNTLYDLSAGSATTLLAHNDTAFRWVAFADGTSHIYAAGNAGTSAAIYRVEVTDDATALDVPIIAGRLPFGETVTGLFGYAGLLFIGTSLGFRVAQQASSGDLAIGPLVELGVPVYGFAAWRQYVWFTWTNFDSTSTGIGRIDPTVQHADGSYAYASDLLAAASGTVRSVAVLDGAVAFGVDASGVWKSSGVPVASGTVDSGIVRFDVTEQKLLVGGSAGWVGPGQVTLSASVDGGAFSTLNESGFNRSGSWFELRITLTENTTSPTVTSAVMRAFELSRPTRVLIVPLLMHDRVVRFGGAEHRFDVTAALDEIRTLWAEGTPTVYQEGHESWAVTVEDYEFRKTHEVIDGSRHQWVGTCTVKLKVLT